MKQERHPYLNNRFRSRMIDVQRGRCVRCGERLDLSRQAITRATRDAPTIDHVVPQTEGGADTLGNLIVLHRKCNWRKADRRATGCEVLWADVLLAVLSLR